LKGTKAVQLAQTTKFETRKPVEETIKSAAPTATLPSNSHLLQTTSAMQNAKYHLPGDTKSSHPKTSPVTTAPLNPHSHLLQTTTAIESGKWHAAEETKSSPKMPISLTSHLLTPTAAVKANKWSGGSKDSYDDVAGSSSSIPNSTNTSSNNNGVSSTSKSPHRKSTANTTDLRQVDPASAPGFLKPTNASLLLKQQVKIDWDRFYLFIFWCVWLKLLVCVVFDSLSHFF
jgi:hypothetical protein